MFIIPHRGFAGEMFCLKREENADRKKDARIKCMLGVGAASGPKVGHRGNFQMRPGNFWTIFKIMDISMKHLTVFKAFKWAIHRPL